MDSARAGTRTAMTSLGVVDELITLAQQIVAHTTHSGTPYADVARS